MYSIKVQALHNVNTNEKITGYQIKNYVSRITLQKKPSEQSSNQNINSGDEV